MDPHSDLSHLSDQEVVALALERRTGAWAELVFRYKAQVRRVIGRYVDTEEHVEQLIQDTFFKAAMFLENYHPENSFAGWIRAIAYHTAVDYTRDRPPDSPSLPTRVYFDVDESLIPAATFQVRTQLQKLVSDGRVIWTPGVGAEDETVQMVEDGRP